MSDNLLMYTCSPKKNTYIRRKIWTYYFSIANYQTKILRYAKKKLLIIHTNKELIVSAIALISIIYWLCLLAMITINLQFLHSLRWSTRSTEAIKQTRSLFLLFPLYNFIRKHSCKRSLLSSLSVSMIIAIYIIIVKFKCNVCCVLRIRNIVSRPLLFPSKS